MMRRDSLATRRQLIDAAERLFAERGIDNVSLLDIGRAAGQKNRNAPQYHFGDKDSLINAVLDRHTDLINQRRRRMLEALPQGDRPSLRELTRILVLPVAEHVAEAENSDAFLLINGQMMTSPPLGGIRSERARAIPEVRQMSELFAHALPRGNPASRRGQMVLIQSMLHHGLASFRALCRGEDPTAFLESLCLGIEAVLSGPATPGEPASPSRPTTNPQETES